MIEIVESNIFQNLIRSALTISLFLGVIPAIRSLLGVLGIGICSLGLGLGFVNSAVSQNYFVAFKTGIFLSIPILISYELVSALSKSLEIVRGSQLAEQLFVQERGGPIEFGLFLLLASLFLSNGGGMELLNQVRFGTALAYDEGQSLQSCYIFVLSKVFALAGLGVVLELIAGLTQRVSRKGFLGAEFSTLRIPLAIYFMIELLESF